MPPDQFVQTALAILGPAAIWLSQSRTPQFQRWASQVNQILDIEERRQQGAK